MGITSLPPQTDASCGCPSDIASNLSIDNLGVSVAPEQGSISSSSNQSLHMVHLRYVPTTPIGCDANVVDRHSGRKIWMRHFLSRLFRKLSSGLQCFERDEWHYEHVPAFLASC